jgi:hypothetical protein
MRTLYGLKNIFFIFSNFPWFFFLSSVRLRILTGHHKSTHHFDRLDAIRQDSIGPLILLDDMTTLVAARGIRNQYETNLTTFGLNYECLLIFFAEQ